MMTPYVQRMVTRLYSKERLQEELFFWLTSFRFSAWPLPDLPGQMVTDLHEGRLRPKTVAEHSPEDRRRQDRNARDLALAVVTGGGCSWRRRWRCRRTPRNFWVCPRRRRWGMCWGSGCWRCW
jgi:hypothetical protein